MQGILQGFRVVGSGSKLGREYPVTAYRLGGRVTLERLLDFIPDSNGEQQPAGAASGPGPSTCIWRGWQKWGRWSWKLGKGGWC